MFNLVRERTYSYDFKNLVYILKVDLVNFYCRGRWGY